MAFALKNWRRLGAASVVALSLVSVAAPVRAEKAAAAKAPAKKVDRYVRPNFLSPTAVAPLTLLPSPPDAGSPEHQEEIQLIRKLQANRTPEQIAQVKRDNSLSVFNFDTVLGPDFTAADFPKTAEFFSLAQVDEGYFARMGKNHYQRPRPTAEPGMKPVFPQGGFSYPSGHSTRATMFAELLAYVLPERRAELIARGQEIGFGREIAGVHYPSDVLAGRMLGHVIAEAFLNDPATRAKLDALRPELQGLVKGK